MTAQSRVKPPQPSRGSVQTHTFPNAIRPNPNTELTHSSSSEPVGAALQPAPASRKRTPREPGRGARVLQESTTIGHHPGVHLTLSDESHASRQAEHTATAELAGQAESSAGVPSAAVLFRECVEWQAPPPPGRRRVRVAWLGSGPACQPPGLPGPGLPGTGVRCPAVVNVCADRILECTR